MGLLDLFRKKTAEPACSFCGHRIKPLGQGRYTEVVGNLPVLYAGVVCKECGSIICVDCQGSPPSKPCKKCGGAVTPAYEDVLRSARRFS